MQPPDSDAAEGPGVDGRTTASSTSTRPSTKDTPALVSTAIQAHCRAGAVAPISARTLTFRLPSAVITTRVQSPFSSGQVIVCSPGPDAWTRQIFTAVGAGEGA
ncbi:hypothetical protein ACQPYH_28340 [Kribbella sp. CA-245084]|uniref:hypothetical protein n=1 Tax=Kribbella sp. CA-245084 TaxID=3239940 RepID=UPI003D929FD6